MSERPSMIDLWEQANRENPSGGPGVRYRELLIEHGYAERVEEGEEVDNTLPCGWPDSGRDQPTEDAS